MSDFSLLLSLDSDALQTLAHAYSSYAAYLDTGNAEDIHTIACCYMKAAAYEMLLDQSNARSLFALAATRFTQINDPYGLIAGICSYQGCPDLSITTEATPDIQFYQLLNGTFTGATVDTSAWQEPVGRLQIPFRLYADAITDTIDQEVTQLPKVWKSLLTRMHTRPRLLSKDTARWRKLEGTITPIEPETVATCIALLRVAERQGISLDILTSLVQAQQDNAYIPMKIGLLLR